MKHGILIAALAFAALGSPARADEPPKPAPAPEQQPSDPCVRGNTMIKLGGVDLAEMRCHEAVLNELYSGAMRNLAAAQARILLLESDRESAKARIAELEKAAPKPADPPAP